MSGNQPDTLRSPSKSQDEDNYVSPDNPPLKRAPPTLPKKRGRRKGASYHLQDLQIGGTGGRAKFEKNEDEWRFSKPSPLSDSENDERQV